MKIKISVALCTYNGGQFLEEQLNSIIHQDYPIYEIQIGDDGSTDNTIDIIHSFKDKFERIYLTVNNQRLGVVKNFEQTIKRCSGDYICLSDQDDIWAPEKLKVIIPLLESNNNIQGCFTDAGFIDERGNEMRGGLWESLGAKKRGNCLLSTERLMEYLLRFGNVVTGATLVIKSGCIDKILPFHQRYENEYHDFIIARKLALKKELMPIDQKLVSYRVHNNQLTGITKKKYWEHYYKIRKNILLKKYDKIGYNDNLRSAWTYYKNVVNEIRYGDSEPDFLLKRYYIESKNEWLNIKKGSFYKLKVPSGKKKSKITHEKSLCYFVGYTETTLDVDLNYIDELKRHFDRVVVLTNQKPKEENPGYEYLFVENKGYDFGLLYQAIKERDLSEYQVFGFVNNSNVLLRDKSLDDFFHWCYSNNSFFCGITDCCLAPSGVKRNKSYHLQSHFLIFKKRAITLLQHFFTEIDFERFFRITNKNRLRQTIINECEIGLSQYMIKNRIKPNSWIKTGEFCAEYARYVGGVNIHMTFWEEMIERGYPLMKKKIVSGEWDEMIPNPENRFKYLSPTGNG